jgi:hypothetical protein
MQGGERRNNGAVVWTRHAGLAVKLRRGPATQQLDSSVGKVPNCRISMDLMFYVVMKWNLIIVLSLAVNYSLSTGLIKNACICAIHYLSIPPFARACNYPCINMPTTHYVTQYGFYSDTTRPV